MDTCAGAGSAPPPLYLSLHPGNAARGVPDATRHRVPSPRGLRHLAPLTAPAPKPTATSAPHPPPTPAFRRVPQPGKTGGLAQELHPHPLRASGVPWGAPARPSHCSAALGSVGGILRSGSGRSARRRGGSGRGACAARSLRPASGLLSPSQAAGRGAPNKTLHLGLRLPPSSRAWSPSLPRPAARPTPSYHPN